MAAYPDPPPVILLAEVGVGGYPQPPEANVKDNGFPWPPPGLLGNFTENAVSPLQERREKEILLRA
jgi:hypothetical protein